ncbi:MAG: hypothetical protein AB1441_01015 [Bacillota bacterium]
MFFKWSGMKKYIVKRDGEPDLKFVGRLLARVDIGVYDKFLGAKRAQEQIEIYKTDSGEYVVALFKRYEFNRALVCETPEAVVAVLRQEPEFGGLKKQALAEAAKKDPSFAAPAESYE